MNSITDNKIELTDININVPISGLITEKTHENQNNSESANTNDVLSDINNENNLILDDITDQTIEKKSDLLSLNDNEIKLSKNETEVKVESMAMDIDETSVTPVNAMEVSDTSKGESPISNIGEEMHPKTLEVTNAPIEELSTMDVDKEVDVADDQTEGLLDSIINEEKNVLSEPQTEIVSVKEKPSDLYINEEQITTPATNTCSNSNPLDSIVVPKDKTVSLPDNENSIFNYKSNEKNVIPDIIPHSPDSIIVISSGDEDDEYVNIGINEPSLGYVLYAELERERKREFKNVDGYIIDPNVIYIVDSDDEDVVNEVIVANEEVVADEIVVANEEVVVGENVNNGDDTNKDKMITNANERSNSEEVIEESNLIQGNGNSETNTEPTNENVIKPIVPQALVDLYDTGSDDSYEVNYGPGPKSKTKTLRNRPSPYFIPKMAQSNNAQPSTSGSSLVLESNTTEGQTGLIVEQSSSTGKNSRNEEIMVNNTVEVVQDEISPSLN